MSFFSLHHLIELLHAYGNVVLGIVVGLESVGLPLPGETLLIAGAVIAATSHQLNIALVILSAAAGAIVGQMTGYAIGWGIGFRLLRRYGRFIGLTDRRLAYGRALFRRHGVKVVFASRFIALLRTLAALLAGANHMPWGRFMTANVAGKVWSGRDFTAAAPICWARRRDIWPARSPSVLVWRSPVPCSLPGCGRADGSTGCWRSRPGPILHSNDRDVTLP